MNWKNELLGQQQRVITYSSPDMPVAQRVIINAVELISGRPVVEDLYKQLRAIDDGTNRIWSHVFPLLDIEVVLIESTGYTIPEDIPIVFIANHPFGILDGMALAKIIAQQRQHFKLLVNEVLCREPLLGRYFLPIDFRQTKEAQRINIESRSVALGYLKNGGAIGIFPAGGVATTPSFFSQKAKDLEWKKFVIKMIRQSGATVVPIFFEGQNSRLFQIASHIHSNLRLGLLLYELMNKRHKPLKVRVGKPIVLEDLPKDNERLLQFLYDQTYQLSITT